MEAEEFDALPEPRAAALVCQMVDFLEQLQALRWEESGSFYPRGVEGVEGRGWSFHGPPPEPPQGMPKLKARRLRASLVELGARLA